MLTEKLNKKCDDCEINRKAQKPVMTDAQLRALTRKHLLMMIRDLEKELAQEKKEKENLLTVCQAIATQMRQPDKVVDKNESQ